jgi:hypothetical protein
MGLGKARWLSRPLALETRSGRPPGAAIGRPLTPARVEGTTLWRASASRAHEWWGAASPPRSSTRASTRPPRGSSSSLLRPCSGLGRCRIGWHRPSGRNGSQRSTPTSGLSGSSQTVDPLPGYVVRGVCRTRLAVSDRHRDCCRVEQDVATRTIRPSASRRPTLLLGGALSRSQGDPALPPKMAEADRA